MKDLEKIQTQMRKGLIEFAVLTVISRKETYSYEILNELKSADLLTAEGTLYPLLSRLRKEELCEYFWKESTSGPPRKYYKLTEKGLKQLERERKAWEQINRSIKFLSR